MTSLIKKLFPLQITKRFFLWIVLLIIIPIITLAVITQLSYLEDRKARRETELNIVASYLDKRLPGSFMEILKQKDSLDKPVDEQVKVLNAVLQPIIEDVSLTHPSIGLGYYSIELDRILAIGPEFDTSMLKPLPHNLQYFKIYETGKPAVVYSNTSVSWKGKPIINLAYPIYRNGKIIGHTWANVNLEEEYAEAWGRRWKILITGPIMLGAIVFMSWLAFRRFKRDLESFANAVVHDNGELPEGIMPEFKPLLDEVKKRTKELQNEITERKHVETALRLKEKKFKSIFMESPIGIELYDKNGLLTNVNKACLDIFGVSNIDELKGFNLFEDPNIPEEEKKKIINGDQVRYEVEFDFDLVRMKRLYETSKFGIIHIDVLISPLGKDGDVYHGFLVHIQEISERKRAEEQLRVSEERFSKAFNSGPVSMVITLLDDGTIIEANENFLYQFGYKREEVIGRTTTELKLFEDINNRSKIVQSIKEQGSVCNSELIYNKKSGDTFIGLYSGVALTLLGKQCIFTIINDITELRQLQKEIARLDQLNLVGEMAASIGHEVRNPMTTVRGFLQLLAKKEECSKHKDYLYLMIEELDRANLIISEFLSLAKNKTAELTMKNLKSIVENLFPLIQADAMESDMYTNLQLENVPDLLLDEKEIRQLILNLVRNGLESMSPGGEMTIKTFVDKEGIVLAVQDDGKGIAPEVLKKIGTPFFTTKEAGTGLGLAVCNSIASRHNAKIDIETNLRGTTFFVRFKQ
ncbi:MAG: PAS domain S-box protein [Bacillota bacterium]